MNNTNKRNRGRETNISYTQEVRKTERERESGQVRGRNVLNIV